MRYRVIRSRPNEKAEQIAQFIGYVPAMHFICGERRYTKGGHFILLEQQGGRFRKVEDDHIPGGYVRDTLVGWIERCTQAAKGPA